VKVDVEYERSENDETIEKRDPRSCVGNRTEGVNCEEDIEGEDAQKSKIDTMGHENNQSLRAVTRREQWKSSPEDPALEHFTTVRRSERASKHCRRKMLIVMKFNTLGELLRRGRKIVGQLN
jgi:hypothetical protein